MGPLSLLLDVRHDGRPEQMPAGAIVDGRRGVCMSGHWLAGWSSVHWMADSSRFMRKD